MSMMALPGMGAEPPVDREALSLALSRTALADATPCVGTCAEELEGGAPGTNDAGPTLAARATIQTPRWNAALAPHGGGPPGSFVRVHGFGDVALTAADGSTVWARGSNSFYPEWGLQPNLIVPVVLMGSAPLDPWTPASERPFAVGDLTGDGVDDVAVGHFVQVGDGEPNALYEDLTSAVTVVDGVDGRTVWHRLYPGYVTQVLIEDRTLVVGNETGEPKGLLGEPGSRTGLDAYRFEGSPDDLQVAEAWSRSTGASWARLLAAEPVGDGRFAVAWTSKPLGSSGDAGWVEVLEASTGQEAWSVQTPGYPRILRLDTERGLVVVADQADPSGPFAYTLRGLRASDGTTAATIERTDAVPVALLVADVTSRPGPEWLTGDLAYLPERLPDGVPEPDIAGRVTAADPGTGADLWVRQVRAGQDFAQDRAGGAAAVPIPYALAAGATPLGPRVIVAADSQDGNSLTALDGERGTEAWERYGDEAFPLFLMPWTHEGEPAILGMTERLVLRSYPFLDGVGSDVPLLYDAHDVVPTDIDGDGTTDLLAGTRSGGVFALDGRDLDDDPGVLWSATVAGNVHRLELADLDGDGDREVVVSHDRGVQVLDAATGAPAYRIDVHPIDLVWTHTLADLDGDARKDILITSRTIAAYRGSNGAKLWEYRPAEDAGVLDVPSDVRVTIRFSNAVLTPEGVVAAQGWVDTPDLLATHHHRFAVGLDARTGAVRWLTPQAGYQATPNIWHSVSAVGPTADGAGTRLAITWDVQNVPLPNQSRRLRIDILDSRDGTVLSTTSLDGLVHQGFYHDPAYGPMEFNRSGVARITENGVVEVEAGAATDVGRLESGDQAYFVSAWRSAKIFPPDAPLGTAGDPPVALDQWWAMRIGGLAVADLEGDGDQELVGHTFDWPGYTDAVWVTDVGVAWDVASPHGIAVLEVRP